ncbi:MAG: LysR family transcriptional regulator [Pseudomonadota bacterium]
MDKLSGLLAFVRTAELGSFAAAGRVLEISASAVGKGVARLEQELGVRLLQRSTRRLQLTDEGRLFHERCRRILDDLHDAQAMLSHAREEPRGRLRVSAPIVGHHFLMPVIPDFLARHRQVELDVVFTDRNVDLIEEGIDVAIRSGDLPDSRLVSRPLQAFRLLLCAAPAYLARRGTPIEPRELARHEAVRFRHPDSGKLLDWPLPGGEPPARTVLACNNMEAVLDGALRGLGIACMPDFLARERLADGRLASVLDAHMEGRGRFNALWPSSRHLSPKVRLFVDHLGRQL